MYSTCLYCTTDLGKNEVIETFPIGRRLAFDGATGRLWAVCRRCERWNLSPIEERWEAVEECERAFGGTRLRVSTDNIGLARLREGLELVRIGSPQRPEMAAWRYGDQFSRRRRKALLYTGAAIAAGTGLVVLGPIMGVIATGGFGVWHVGFQAHSAYQARRVRGRVTVPGADTKGTLRLRHLKAAKLVQEQDSWALQMAYELPKVPLDAPGRPRPKAAAPRFRPARHYQEVTLRGEEAMRVAGQLLPAVNERGAGGKQIQGAVNLLQETPDPASLFGRIARGPEEIWRSAKYGIRHPRLGPKSAVLSHMAPEIRLALEMAAHEEQERRAMEGELAILEAAWREADEIARIADNLLLPAAVERRLRELEGGH